MLKEYVFEPSVFCDVGSGFRGVDDNITNVFGFNGIKYVNADTPGVVRCKFSVLSNVEDSLAGQIFVFNATVNASGCSQVEVAPIDEIGAFEGRFTGRVNVVNAPQTTKLYTVAKSAQNSCQTCQDSLEYYVSVTNTENLTKTDLPVQQIGSGAISGSKEYKPEENTTFSFNISGKGYRAMTRTSLSAIQNTEFYMATHRIYLENARHHLNGKQTAYFTTKDDERFEVAITQTQRSAAMTYNDPELLVTGEVRCLNKLDPLEQTCVEECPIVSLLATCFDRCPRNFFLYGKECVQRCPFGTAPNYDEMKCKDDKREACDGGMVLLNGSCVTSCYPGMKETDGVCMSAEECPRYTVAGETAYCANECPAGLYISSDGKECIEECPGTHNATHCIEECANGAVFEDNYCGAACRP